MPESKIGWRMEQDDSGHWYMVPCDELLSFQQWVEKTEKGEDTTLDFAHYRIDGPHRVKIWHWDEV